MDRDLGPIEEADAHAAPFRRAAIARDEHRGDVPLPFLQRLQRHEGEQVARARVDRGVADQARAQRRIVGGLHAQLDLVGARARRRPLRDLRHLGGESTPGPRVEAHVSAVAQRDAHDVRVAQPRPQHPTAPGGAEQQHRRPRADQLAAFG